MSRDLAPKKVIRFLAPFLDKQEDNSDHGALLTTFRQVIEAVGNGVSNILKNRDFPVATGKYLDKWGRFYGIPRYQDESDEQYRKRIILEITSAKLTVASMIKTVALFSPDLDENEISIFEPFRELLPLNNGFTTNNSIFPGYTYWTWGIVDVQTQKPISERAKQKLEEYKAAGVMITYSTLFTHISTVRRWTPQIHHFGISTHNSLNRCLQDYVLSGESGLLNGGGQVI